MKDIGPVPFPPQSRPPPGVFEPPSLATTFLCSRDEALFSTQNPTKYTAQLYSVPFAPHNQEENSLEEREGW